MCCSDQSELNSESTPADKYGGDICELAVCRLTTIFVQVHRSEEVYTHFLVRCKTVRAAAYLDPGPGTASRLCQYAELSLCGCASAAMRASMLLLGPEKASDKALLMLLSLRPLMGRELNV